MTNIVPAGANRPAATARTRRAAQNTPLPPKSEDTTEEFNRLMALPLSEQAAPANKRRIKALANRPENTGLPLKPPAPVGATDPQMRYRARAAEPTALDKLDTAPGKTPAEVQYGRMTVSELQARYIKLTKSQPKSSWKKGDLLNAILAFERHANAKVDQALSPNKNEAKIDAAFEVAPKAAKKAPSAPVAAAGGSGKSRPKADAFSVAAATYGWATTLKEHGEDRVSVVAARGAETIYIEWMAGVFTAPCPYTIGARTIQLKNASAAKMRMAMAPENATEEAAKVAARKAAPSAPAAPKKAPRVKPLPFNEASQDDEVLTALLGRKISWTNRISGEVETDYVHARAEIRNKNNMPKVVDGPDGRVLNFTSSSGFRSVLVSAITSVR